MNSHIQDQFMTQKDGRNVGLVTAEQSNLSLAREFIVINRAICRNAEKMVSIKPCEFRRP